jgi:hypothetical protein
MEIKIGLGKIVSKIQTTEIKFLQLKKLSVCLVIGKIDSCRKNG